MYIISGARETFEIRTYHCLCFLLLEDCLPVSKEVTYLDEYFRIVQNKSIQEPSPLK